MKTVSRCAGVCTSLPSLAGPAGPAAAPPRRTPRPGRGRRGAPTACRPGGRRRRSAGCRPRRRAAPAGSPTSATTRSYARGSGLRTPRSVASQTTSNSGNHSWASTQARPWKSISSLLKIAVATPAARARRQQVDGARAGHLDAGVLEHRAHQVRLPVQRRATADRLVGVAEPVVALGQLAGQVPLATAGRRPRRRARGRGWSGAAGRSRRSNSSAISQADLSSTTPTSQQAAPPGGRHAPTPPASGRSPGSPAGVPTRGGTRGARPRPAGPARAGSAPARRADHVDHRARRPSAMSAQGHPGDRVGGAVDLDDPRARRRRRRWRRRSGGSRGSPRAAPTGRCPRSAGRGRRAARPPCSRPRTPPRPRGPGRPPAARRGRCRHRAASTSPVWWARAGDAGSAGSRSSPRGSRRTPRSAAAGTAGGRPAPRGPGATTGTVPSRTVGHRHPGRLHRGAVHLDDARLRARRPAPSRRRRSAARGRRTRAPPPAHPGQVGGVDVRGRRRPRRPARSPRATSRTTASRGCSPWSRPPPGSVHSSPRRCAAPAGRAGSARRRRITAYAATRCCRGTRSSPGHGSDPGP